MAFTELEGSDLFAFAICFICDMMASKSFVFEKVSDDFFLAGTAELSETEFEVSKVRSGCWEEVRYQGQEQSCERTSVLRVFPSSAFTSTTGGSSDF